MPKRDAISTNDGSAHRAALLKCRAEILESLGINQEDLSRAEQVNEDDQAKLIHDQWVSLSLNRLEYKNLRLVNEALDRLAAGDYGVCPNCDEPIPPKRLEAIPWAKYCVNCQDHVAEGPDEPSTPGLTGLYAFTKQEDSVSQTIPVTR